MVSSMRKHGKERTNCVENIFRMADSEEISCPQQFRHLYQSQEWMNWNRVSVMKSSVLGRDDNEDRIRAMQAKFEKPQVKTFHKEAGGGLPWPADYGNEGGDCTLTKEDISQLCQQWHDKFMDIVNGT